MRIMLHRLVFPMILTLTGALAAPASAHPHVFIETALRIIVDDAGRTEGIEVSWTYDELYSLLVLEDMQLDGDYDGKLTEEELQRLDGFDLQWIPGFEGDLYVHQGDRKLRLGAPQGRGTRVEDARITTVHYRPLEASADGLQVEAYDPTFYTAYDLGGGVSVTGGCKARIQPADLNAAYALLEELLFATPQAEAEDDFPEVGAEFADTVIVQCR